VAGKGAYGCVKMAYRRSDRLLAVAKFILKEKVGAQFWVDAPDARRLPLELSLLLTLAHPNIVSSYLHFFYGTNPSINNTVDTGSQKRLKNIRAHFKGLVAYININLNLK
jgi:serine/threonine protein kinase